MRVKVCSFTDFFFIIDTISSAINKTMFLLPIQLVIPFQVMLYVLILPEQEWPISLSFAHLTLSTERTC